MLTTHDIQVHWLRHGFTFAGRHCFVLTTPSRVLAAANLPT
jgi:hypothetical protein